ncbi:hypothetical protein BVC80_8951g28 [Macleaya cordata]|uniref:Uncharacterized protein n=1 Tax=Macleaya cordata TaxID=56857 RepID=A0A200QWT7_MACCD|nr:hypothetical protein BVC80_8951g28 [Macleaya cordata]
MLRSSAAVASRVLRLMATSSRPSILLYHRPITTVPINPVRQLLFVDPKPQFVADQSRSYARGRGRAAPSSDEDVEDTDEDSEVSDCDDMDDPYKDFSEDDEDDLDD